MTLNQKSSRKQQQEIIIPQCFWTISNSGRYESQNWINGHKDCDSEHGFSFGATVTWETARSRTERLLVDSTPAAREPRIRITAVSATTGYNRLLWKASMIIRTSATSLMIPIDIEWPWCQYNSSTSMAIPRRYCTEANECGSRVFFEVLLPTHYQPNKQSPNQANNPGSKQIFGWLSACARARPHQRTSLFQSLSHGHVGSSQAFGKPS